LQISLSFAHLAKIAKGASWGKKRAAKGLPRSDKKEKTQELAFLRLF
jgi:hypothetical protein